MAKASKKQRGRRKKGFEQPTGEYENNGLPADVEEETAAPAEADKAVETAEAVEAQPKEEPPKDKKAAEESTHAKYERIKKSNLYLRDLQKLNVAELHALAKKENIQEYTALKKQDLIFRILKERIRQNGLLYGEGVLEVLPDGYGFLRNPDYNYLSSPDDIYVSPSQIRRFGLRTGNIVSGQIRPPKDSEKYFALLRVEAINFQDPDILSEKVVFSDLTPLHPERLFIL